MAILDTNRMVFEVLAKAQVMAGLTFQGAEVLADVDFTAITSALYANRTSIEVLAKVPAQAALTSAGVELLADVSDFTPVSVDDLHATRCSIEVIQSAPEKAALTSQGVEVIADVPGGASAGDLDMSRLSFEVIGRRFIPVSDSTLPTGLLFFSHNWATGCSLSSAYETDVAPAADSIAEERRQLLDRPKRTLDVSWTIEGLSNVDTFLVEMRRYLAQDMAVPLYCDVVEVDQVSASGQKYLYCDVTKARFFPNGHVAIIHHNSTGVPTVEYNQISIKLGSSLVLKNNISTTATPGRCQVVPVVHCDQLLSLETTALRNHLYVVSAALTEVYGPSALPPTATDHPGGFEQYAGYPILDLAHNWDKGLTMSLEREGTRHEVGRGTYIDARGERHRVVHKLAFLEERDTAWKLINFFDSRRGRLRAFWLTDLEDIWTVLEINMVSNYIAIDPLGDFDAFQDEMDYIGIEFSDGTSAVREAVTVQEVLGVWRVILDSAIPTGYSPSDVRRVGRARLCRNKNDSLTENWHTNTICSFEVEVIELLEEGSVDLS